MKSLFLLTLLIFLVKSADFEIAGLSTNMSFIYFNGNSCNYDNCPKLICNILNNTTSAYIILSPLNKISSCSKIPFNFNVNMISFILNDKMQILLPNSCNTINDCMMQSCNSYISNKNSFLMAFTGQCLN